MKKSQVSILTLLLGVAAVATTLAYLVFRICDDRSYQRKWSDYDDCGIF